LVFLVAAGDFTEDDFGFGHVFTEVLGDFLDRVHVFADDFAGFFSDLFAM